MTGFHSSVSNTKIDTHITQIYPEMYPLRWIDETCMNDRIHETNDVWWNTLDNSCSINSVISKNTLFNQSKNKKSKFKNKSSHNLLKLKEKWKIDTFRMLSKLLQHFLVMQGSTIREREQIENDLKMTFADLIKFQAKYGLNKWEFIRDLNTEWNHVNKIHMWNEWSESSSEDDIDSKEFFVYSSSSNLELLQKPSITTVTKKRFSSIFTNDAQTTHYRNHFHIVDDFLKYALMKETQKRLQEFFCFFFGYKKRFEWNGVVPNHQAKMFLCSFYM